MCFSNISFTKYSKALIYLKTVFDIDISYYEEDVEISKYNFNITFYDHNIL